MEQRLTLHLWQRKLQSMPWLAPLWARAPLVVVGVMVIALAQLAAQVSWQWFTPAMAPTTRSTTSVIPASNSRKENLVDVVNAHLFGKAALQVDKGPITAPVTRLRLNLNGVFASDDPKLAMAIISDSSGEQKYYRIGDAVPGGARLHAIYPDRVILDRQGKLETLKLPREVAPINAVAISPDAAASSSTQLPMASTRVHTVEASEKVKQLREKMITSPQEVWKDVRIEPVMENGVIEGYRFAHKDRRLMQSLGLTPDDVIVEINGMTLSDPSVLYDLMQQLTTMENVSLTIKRKGHTETIEVKM